jgi:ABC-type amino acid transport substrate-binding protein
VSKLILALAAVAAVVVAAPAMAATTVAYQATYVEPVGGPNQSPFGCASGTTCGSANISGIGNSDTYYTTFNVCGFGCHVRTITFDDGSTLLIRVEDQPAGFAFTSPGNSGSNGYIGFPGLAGNPQFLEVKETIIGGTGRFAGATGSGSGTVALHGGIAIGKTSGTITLC